MTILIFESAQPFTSVFTIKYRVSVFTTRNNRDLTNCCYFERGIPIQIFVPARPMNLYFLPLLPCTKPLWIVMHLYDSMYIVPSSHLSVYCVHMAEVFMKTLGSLCPSDPHEDCCRADADVHPLMKS